MKRTVASFSHPDDIGLLVRQRDRDARAVVRTTSACPVSALLFFLTLVEQVGKIVPSFREHGFLEIFGRFHMI